MTRQEFVSELEFLFNVGEGDLPPEKRLDSLKSWDSLGMLGVITLMKEVGAKVAVNQLRQCETVDDIVKLAEESFN